MRKNLETSCGPTLIFVIPAFAVVLKFFSYFCFVLHVFFKFNLIVFCHNVKQPNEFWPALLVKFFRFNFYDYYFKANNSNLNRKKPMPSKFCSIYI